MTEPREQVTAWRVRLQGGPDRGECKATQGVWLLSTHKAPLEHFEEGGIIISSVYWLLSGE